MKTSRIFRTIGMAAAATALLVGCSIIDSDGDDKPLPGERVSILELQKKLEPDRKGALELDAQGFVAPSPWNNEFWPQAGGYPNHAMQHLALSGEELKKIWSVSIGAGSTDELPLTAQPIVIDGKIFTMDTEAGISAFSIADGKRLWHTTVSNRKEGDPVIGGGLAFSQGQLFVTNGYDEALSLSPADGHEIWRVKIPAPSRAAPTVVGDRVFITTLDNRIFALNSGSGRMLWDYAGVSESAGLVGAASPAASNEVVVPAFSSGELYALRVENGTMAWSENLTSAGAVANGMSALADIRGLPVIDKGVVFAVSFGGRLVAIDERTGDRIWQRDIGSAETPWIAGNHLFVISTDNEVVALGRDTGAIRWVTPLPRYQRPDSRKDPIFWTAPILAGGRLILAASNGDVAEVSPETGEILRVWRAESPVSITPVVAGGVLYILGDNGKLTAYQ